MRLMAFDQIGMSSMGACMAIGRPGHGMDCGTSGRWMESQDRLKEEGTWRCRGIVLRKKGEQWLWGEGWKDQQSGRLSKVETEQILPYLRVGTGIRRRERSCRIQQWLVPVPSDPIQDVGPCCEASSAASSLRMTAQRLWLMCRRGLEESREGIEVLQ